MATASAAGAVAVRQSAPADVHARYQRERDVHWGQNSAHMAYITLQHAFRQEVHASYWFGD